MDYKILLWIISSILAIVWYFPYIKDTIKWKTVPHIYTWLIWWILVWITFVIQFQNQWWAWSWVTWVTAISCFIIVILSLKFGAKNITSSDTISLILAFWAMGLWYFLNNPLYSIILILIIETLAFYPTFRKSLKKPFEETLSTYVIASIRSAISIAALTSINLVNIAFPLYLFLVYGVFAILLVFLRKRDTPT